MQEETPEQGLGGGAETTAEQLDEAGIPAQVRNWKPARLAVPLAVVCVALALGMVGDFLLHRYDTGGPGQISGLQLQSLQLDGVWNGPGGAKLTLSGRPGSGTFVFSGITSTMFAISNNTSWPADQSSGTWSIGQLQDSQWSETGLVLSGSRYDGDEFSPQLMLLAIGSPSSPQLACYFPLNAGVCVFKR
jgi:hypothetical protein